jgi:EmrB/QacA subfamily drug resistance transporter
VTETTHAQEASLDPRRWWTLVIVLATVIITLLDLSVLNVAIPTILHDLHTTVPSVEWVITGYSLIYASLMMVGGRLGDIYGHRRIYVVGLALFGIGSLISALAPSVGVLLFSHVIIEGTGAAFLAPNNLAILSNTFRGAERPKAFALWGATMGAAVAFGPVVGGFLTTDYSWRWAFGINVLIVPLTIVGAMFFMPSGQRKARIPVDLPGAAMIAVGTFLLIFSFSQGGIYGWSAPIKAFDIGTTTLWPVSAPCSISLATLLISLLTLAGFVVYERAKERRGDHPLFEFSQLRFKTFRYGLPALIILGLAQLGMMFALALFLQEAVHLTALQNGLWLAPAGIAVMVGAQTGGFATRWVTPTTVVRIGMAIQVVAYLLVGMSITRQVAFWELVPALSVVGLGVGLTSSQLTSVCLSEISIEKSGVASGANVTARQLGAALGVAILGSILTVQALNHALAAIPSSHLSAVAQSQLAAAVRAAGPNAKLPPGLGAAATVLADRVLGDSVGAGTRAAMLFNAVAVAVGLVFACLIPRVKVASAHSPIEVMETFDDLELAIADPRETLGRAPFDGP